MNKNSTPERDVTYVRTGICTADVEDVTKVSTRHCSNG